MKNWDNVVLVPEFDEQGVACYRLEGGDYENEYYVISEAESRKLLNTPEIVGYEVYNCLVSSTSQMLYYLKEQKKVTTANILSILRGALNYPLEEACYREHIRVHDISFLSSERVFEKEEIAGLEIKYSKLTMVPDSCLLYTSKKTGMRCFGLFMWWKLIYQGILELSEFHGMFSFPDGK